MCCTGRTRHHKPGKRSAGAQAAAKLARAAWYRCTPQIALRCSRRRASQSIKAMPGASRSILRWPSTQAKRLPVNNPRGLKLVQIADCRLQRQSRGQKTKQAQHRSPGGREDQIRKLYLVEMAFVSCMNHKVPHQLGRHSKKLLCDLLQAN